MALGKKLIHSDSTEYSRSILERDGLGPGVHYDAVPLAALAVVARLELFVEFVVPEFGLGVRLPLRNDLIIELALHLAIEDLQLLIFHAAQILGKAVLRGEMQFLFHHALRAAMPSSACRL